MCLIPESPTQDLKSFAEIAGVELVHVGVQRTMPVGSALQALLLSAVSVCIDASKHPVYVHCLDGRRITSLFVLILRRLQGWLPLSALGEYWRYQSLARSPTVGLIEVEKIVREVENFASELSEVVVPERIPNWLWSGNRNMKLSGVKLKFSPPLAFAHSSHSHHHHQADSSNSSNAGGSSGGGGGGGGMSSTSRSGMDKMEEQYDHSSDETERPSAADGTNQTQQPVAVSRALSALDLHGLDLNKKRKG